MEAPIEWASAPSSCEVPAVHPSPEHGLPPCACPPQWSSPLPSVADHQWACADHRLAQRCHVPWELVWKRQVRKADCFQQLSFF